MGAEKGKAEALDGLGRFDPRSVSSATPSTGLQPLELTASRCIAITRRRTEAAVRKFHVADAQEQQSSAAATIGFAHCGTLSSAIISTMRPSSTWRTS